MFFDTVLDSSMHTVFTGTTEETVEWLKANPWASEFQVCVSVRSYLESHYEQS